MDKQPSDKSDRLVPILMFGFLVFAAIYALFITFRDKKVHSQNPPSAVQQPVGQTTPQSPNANAVPTPSSKQIKTYTMVEVAKHGTDQENYVDCWTVIHDKVYNITEYADSMKHPGGEQIYQACGKDATELFENRPGKGTPHPQSARDILEKYYIGDLKK